MELQGPVVRVRAKGVDITALEADGLDKATAFFGQGTQVGMDPRYVAEAYQTERSLSAGDSVLSWTADITFYRDRDQQRKP